MKNGYFISSLLAGSGYLLGTAAWGADWPMWGGSPDRNMVSSEKDIATAFEKHKPGETKTEDGIVKTFTNYGFEVPSEEELGPQDLKAFAVFEWEDSEGIPQDEEVPIDCPGAIMKLGSQSYGTPVIAGGKIFVGTNNETPRDAKYEGDKGVVMCFDEKTHAFLWQMVLPKLGAGKVSDWEFLGICSSPAIEGERAYVVTNRAEIVCLDTEGLKNGNQGMQEESKLYAESGKPPVELGSTDADVIWTFDMREELGVFPHNIASSSVLVMGDKVVCTTSNGVDWSHTNLPSPLAPSMIILDAESGELLAEEVSNISERVLHCSWSSPMRAESNGEPVIIFGAGDGWLYGFDPTIKTETEEGEEFGVMPELFRYDCNPPEYRKGPDGEPIKYATPKGPNEVVATPVFYDGLVYVLTGQDPEHGEGVGMLSCIDPNKRGDISGQAEWTFKGIERSMSTPAIKDGLLYTADYRGFVYCIDAKTGEKYWEYDTFGHIWGSPLVVDDKVYIGNEEGELKILATGKEMKELATVEFHGPIYSSPVVANGTLYIMTMSHLYAFSQK